MSEDKFTDTIFELVDFLREVTISNTDMNDVLRLRRMIAIYIESQGKCEFIELCIPHIVVYAEHIKSENEEFFLRTNMTNITKDEMANKLFNIIKKHYIQCSDSDKDMLKLKAKLLLNYCIQYSLDRKLKIKKV